MLEVKAVIGGKQVLQIPFHRMNFHNLTGIFKNGPIGSKKNMAFIKDNIPDILKGAMIRRQQPDQRSILKDAISPGIEIAYLTLGTGINPVILIDCHRPDYSVVGYREIHPGRAIESEQPVVVGKIDLSGLILGRIPVLGPGLVDLPRVVPNRGDAYVDALGEGDNLPITDQKQCKDYQVKIVVLRILHFWSISACRTRIIQLLLVFQALT